MMDRLWNNRSKNKITRLIWLIKQQTEMKITHIMTNLPMSSQMANRIQVTVTIRVHRVKKGGPLWIILMTMMTTIVIPVPIKIKTLINQRTPLNSNKLKTEVSRIKMSMTQRMRRMTSVATFLLMMSPVTNLIRRKDHCPSIRFPVRFRSSWVSRVRAIWWLWHLK